MSAEPAQSHFGDRGKPVLCVRQKYFPLRYYVIARWGDGSERKITKFREKQNALDWIEDYSERWLEGSI